MTEDLFSWGWVQKGSQGLFSAKSLLFPITLSALLRVPLRKVLWNFLLLLEDIYQRGSDPAGFGTGGFYSVLKFSAFPPIVSYMLGSLRGGKSGQTMESSVPWFCNSTWQMEPYGWALEKGILSCHWQEFRAASFWLIKLSLVNTIILAV